MSDESYPVSIMLPAGRIHTDSCRRFPGRPSDCVRLFWDRPTTIRLRRCQVETVSAMIENTNVNDVIVHVVPETGDE